MMAGPYSAPSIIQTRRLGADELVELNKIGVEPFVTKLATAGLEQTPDSDLLETVRALFVGRTDAYLHERRNIGKVVLTP